MRLGCAGGTAGGQADHLRQSDADPGKAADHTLAQASRIWKGLAVASEAETEGPQGPARAVETPEAPSPDASQASAASPGEPSVPPDGAPPKRARALRRVEDEDERRPALFSQAADRLTGIERFNIAFIRRTFSSRPLDALMRWCQRVPGTGWVDYCTRKLRHVYGLERLPPPGELERFIIVSNHRSYFDLYVITMILFRAGLRRRVLFPVRANFFYDRLLGLAVNGIMSWFSMYPPIFRDRKKLALNHTAMSEIAWFLQNRHMGAGIHPEGTRNQGDDPYTLLPAQSGVGRVIHQARVAVLPVFINGLINNLPRQVASNFDGTGKEVVVVFGEPIDFGGLLDQPPTARTFKAIADQTMETIAKLGAEERAHRAALTGSAGSAPASSSPPA